MNNAEFQLRGIGDPRLAVHATSALPAWLWSIDGTRILWANPVGASLFGAANGAILAKRTFGPADTSIAARWRSWRTAAATGAIRLERLRGFGASLGTLVTCGCARLDFADGSHGILVAAAEPVGRAMPLVERLQRLVEGIDTPIAAFARDGMFIGASDAAQSLLGFRNLTEAGLDEARSDALKQGRAETPVGIGHMVLQRVGTGADIGLVALIAAGGDATQRPVRRRSPNARWPSRPPPRLRPSLRRNGRRWHRRRLIRTARDLGRSPGRVCIDRRIREAPARREPPLEAARRTRPNRRHRPTFIRRTFALCRSRRR
jgi:PAS domain-containing protein